MPSVIAEALAASVTGEAVSQLSSRLSGQTETTHPSPASTIARFQTLAKARTILGGPLNYGDKKVLSPIVEILAGMYKGDLLAEKVGAGKTYVFYAPPSTGKTTGAQYFFERGLPKLETTGIMISGTARNYHNHMATLLGCDVSDGTWPASLTAAMMPEPGDHRQGSYPPLLLLDEINWLGENDVNILFMDIFMRLVVDRRFICVVQTQNLQVANKLCNLNAGQKIAPLPSLLETPWLGVTEKVPWKIVQWEATALVKLVRSRFPGRFEQEERFDWVVDGMTPTHVITEASKRCSAQGCSKESCIEQDD